MELGTLRNVPRDAWLLLGSALFASMPIGLLLVFYPLYLHALGIRSVFVGAVFTAAGIGSSLLLIVIGPLADRFGRRPFLLGGTAAPMLGFAIFALTTNQAWMILASVLGGVGFSGGLGGGLTQATFNPTLVGTVPPRMRTTVLTLQEATWGLAMCSGALLAGLPALLTGVHLMSAITADRLLFLGCLASTAIATILLLAVRTSGHDVHAEEARGTIPAGRTTRQELRANLPLILKLALFFGVQGAGLGLVVQLMPLWFALRFHASAATIAPWFAVALVIGVPFLLLVPALARRLGVARTVILVSGTSTVLLVGVPLAPTLTAAALFYIARSAFVGMQWPVQLSFLQGAVTPRVRSTATSVTMGCWSLTAAVFPSLTGYLLDRRLLGLPLMLGIGCYAIATVWFWLALRHTPLPEEAPVEDELGAVEPVAE